MNRRLRRYENKDRTDCGYLYWCQGCEELHQVRTTLTPGRPCWSFNGDEDSPTFIPSVLVRTVSPNRPRKICHAFITNGMVQFLADCTHALAGQNLPLPDLPDYMQRDDDESPSGV